jgi:hypothetical protein
MSKNISFMNLIFGIIIGYALSIISFTIVGVHLSDIEPIIKIISYTFISASAVVALLQYNRNINKSKKEEAWNEKHLAYIEINKHIKNLEKYRSQLDKTTLNKKMIMDNGKALSFSDRRIQSKPLSPDEIHKWICERDKKGDELCVTTLHGANVIRYLISIINTYEFISTGIRQGLLNRELTLKLLSSSIVNNFVFFQEYIKHRRIQHDNKDLASEWEALCIEIKKGG